MAKEYKFQEDLAYFVANQKSLVAKYGGKVLVIKNSKIIGVYDTPLEAYLQSQKDNAPGSFMIQQCLPGPDAYTTTISSSLCIPFKP